MLRIGYRRCESDFCVYSHVFKDGKIILLLLYVDDMLIACQDMSKVQELKIQLGKEFDMKDLGPAQKILSKYIAKVLERFNMLDCKPVSTPLVEHFRLSAQESPSTVGCLMYAMVCTSLDLAQAVSVVSRYMANPGKQHWNAVKWIFRYLKGTKRFGILFERQQRKACVLGYVDSDYAGDLDKRRSTTGYVFVCGGGPAEYMALTEASKEALWLQRLAQKFGIAQDLVVIKCDSQSAICLAKNQVYHGRSKHIHVRDIAIEKVHTDENASDCLTEPVTTEKFRHCLSLLNLVTC
ncbi:hypothetical protein ACE6H2_024364 [Prunus campanulata]